MKIKELDVIKLRNGQIGVVIDDIAILQDTSVPMDHFNNCENNFDNAFDIVAVYRPHSLNDGINGLLSLENADLIYLPDNYKSVSVNDAMRRIKTGIKVKCILDDEVTIFNDKDELYIHPDMILRGRWFSLDNNEGMLL